jgi:GNAT superfamily N-acetyltransferase
LARVLIREFTPEDIEPAGILLARRHRAHRQAEPLLSPRFEDPIAAGPEIADLWSRPEASGVVAVAGGRLQGYVLGVHRPNGPWRPNVWIEAAGHAATEPELIRDLYAYAAERWVADGRTAHYALVPATDPALVDAWFRLGFGQQHVHALREADAGLANAGLPAVRLAASGDIDALAELEALLPEHQSRAPVFSTVPGSSLAELRAEWEEALADPHRVSFVWEQDREILGCAHGCSVEHSGAHSGVARPDDAGLLVLAVVRPDARGWGIGRALGERVIGWAAETGYRTVVVDWRATNLLSSRAWPRLGFRPTFLRLFRNI